jgi:RNA binding exosome subunit
MELEVMSSQNQGFKINDIKIFCSAHATEDTEKVKQSMLHLIPETNRTSTEITEIPIEGHAGNPITLLELVITQKRKINDSLVFLAEKIDDLDKETIAEELDNRIGEDNSLYLRFNKQEAFNEVLKLDNADNTIRLTIKFIIYKTADNLIQQVLTSHKIIK